MRGKSLGVFLLATLTLAAIGQDRSKKAIEVVYDDVQVLKQQVQEIRATRDQIKAVADLVRQSMTGQAGLLEGLRAVPVQYQDIVRKIDQLTLELQKLAAAGRIAEKSGDAVLVLAGSGLKTPHLLESVPVEIHRIPLSGLESCLSRLI